mgnify:CR=1 FL=1
MTTQVDRPAEGASSQARAFTDRLLDTVEALVVVLDADRRIVRFNQKCQEVTGYSASEARGEDIVEFLIPPEDRTEVREVFATLTEGTAPLSCENYWLTKEGDRRCIQWTNTILRDEEGQVARVVGTGIDVTKCRRLERKVVATSEEERRRIGAELHDMLAPQLAGTAMMLDALAKKVEKKNSEVASEICVAAGRVREAGEQTRALSHSLMPSAINDGDLPSGLEVLAERQEEMRDFTCSFEKEDPIPALREETVSHLYHIASEAVTNAAQHATPSTVTIRLETSDDHLMLSVRDDGAGMPEEIGPKAGAGLHLMEARAGLIGADLEIDAAEGGGTLVRCSLPLGERGEEGG